MNIKDFWGICGCGKEKEMRFLAPKYNISILGLWSKPQAFRTGQEDIHYCHLGLLLEQTLGTWLWTGEGS